MTYPTYYPQGAQHIQPPAAFSQPQQYPRQAQPYAPGVVAMQPRPLASLNEPSRATLQAMYRSNPQASQQLNTMLGNLGSNMEVRAAQDISRMTVLAFSLHMLAFL